MNRFKSMKLMEMYADCPKCGNEYIGNGQGGVIVEENIFRRFCKCGFDISLDENGNKIEIKNCESCNYFLYSKNEHEEYYCDYHEAYIEDLVVCENYKDTN